MIQNWKPSALIVISWFFYSLLIIWLYAQLYLQTYFIYEWLFANTNEENYSFLTFGFSLYDLLINTILTIPFAIFAVKLLPGKSLWPALTISVIIAFIWQYRLVLSSSNEFISFFSLPGLGVYTGIFYTLFSMPIITFIVKKLHRAKPI